MPRKRKTLTGADAQNIGSVPGRRYGEGVEQQAMQRAMPAPDGMSTAPTNVERITPRITAPMPSNPASGDQLQQFLAQNNPALLQNDPFPDQPVTAGLSMGPGPGPEALRMGAGTSPIARTLRLLTEQTGNPRWNELARKARM